MGARASSEQIVADSVAVFRLGKGAVRVDAPVSAVTVINQRSRKGFLHREQRGGEPSGLEGGGRGV